MTNPVPRAMLPQVREDSGLICFLDNKRPCGADCMAWVQPPDGADYKDQQFSNCMVLVNLHRVGKHAVVLAAQGADLLKKLKITEADRARGDQPPPPAVR